MIFQKSALNGVVFFYFRDSKYKLAPLHVLFFLTKTILTVRFQSCTTKRQKMRFSNHCLLWELQAAVISHRAYQPDSTID